jgi:hypothetical protein
VLTPVGSGGFAITDTACNRNVRKAPTMITSVPPTPRLASIRQARFGAESRSRNARPRVVEIVVVGPETFTASGRTPRDWSHVAVTVYPSTPTITHNRVLIGMFITGR